MRKQSMTKAGAGIVAIMMAVLLCMQVAARAGSLEPSAPPTAGSMKTLQEIYDKLEVIDSKLGGGSTTTTIDGTTTTTIIPAPLAKTGQTISYAPGDDGALRKGMEIMPRFSDQGNGTVLDNLTGLVWLKNANPCGTKTWSDAIAYCNSLASGYAGLTDGSVAGAWRLPNYKELFSLVDASKYNPPLPSGHPFTGVQSPNYWSSTSYVPSTDYAWSVSMYTGYLDHLVKSLNLGYVWPVRGGN